MPFKFVNIIIPWFHYQMHHHQYYNCLTIKCIIISTMQRINIITPTGSITPSCGNYHHHYHCHYQYQCVWLKISLLSMSHFCLLFIMWVFGVGVGFWCGCGFLVWVWFFWYGCGFLVWVGYSCLRFFSILTPIWGQEWGIYMIPPTQSIRITPHYGIGGREYIK